MDFIEFTRWTEAFKLKAQDTITTTDILTNWENRVSEKIKTFDYLLAKSKEASAFIYLLMDHKFPQWVKIGSTNKPRVRANQYKKDLDNFTLYLIDENSLFFGDIERTYQFYFDEYNFHSLPEIRPCPIKFADWFYINKIFAEFAIPRIKIAIDRGWFVSGKNGIIIYPKAKDKKIKQENRNCVCGCNQIFRCKINSKQKFIWGHHKRGKLFWKHYEPDRNKKKS